MLKSGMRPDPDQLLAAVNDQEARARRGKLRIFFGGSAGVGKTYSMLEAAHRVSETGADLVVGYIEPHGRAETESLREGLEQLPTLPVRYRGLVRQEFDLDAALKRRPAIALVDELAHSNLIDGDPPPRHAKRWQDIEELLEAGINVWTTVNVQHLESLNDLVAQITGVRQRETIPDRIFDEADEVELIDLPPDDLLGRLQAGLIYLPEEARTAADRFFRKSNLIALRELSLRRMADRVDASARATASLDRASRAWMARDRLLVAVGPDEQAEQLVRAGKRMADALDAVWSVVYVETPELLRLSQHQRNRRIDVLRLAESLGAETVTLDGPTAAETLTEYAHTRNATRVIVGAPKRRGWRALLRASTATALARKAKGFDVITIAPADSPKQVAVERSDVPEMAMPVHWDRYAWALATTLICTLIGFSMQDSFEAANIVMVYVLGATIAGVRFGRGPAVLTAIANVFAFDFCFVPPHFTFSVADAQYVVTFAVMLIVTLVIANLMASVRQQTRVAGARERRTYLLYAMSRELAATRGIAEMARVAVRHVAEVFQCQAVVLLPDAAGKLKHPREVPEAGSLRGADLSIAQWVLDHGRRAGLDSDTLPAAPALYLPLGSEQQQLGVLAVLPQNRRRVLLPEQRRLLETFAAQIGLAVERGKLAETAESSRVAAETESLRNTLLASISHDLRTPLAVIAGASSTLVEQGDDLDTAVRRKLARSIESKARDMTDLVSNVLDLMRFESGQVALRREWETLDDLLGTALIRMQERLGSHEVTSQLPADLPPVHVDANLIVQVFVNLLENVVKYTPPETSVTISAVVRDDAVAVTCDDSGPGLPAGEASRLFDKFQRGNDEGATVGAGLGLAICRAIVRAHGGDITAGARPGGGARFVFTLPLKEGSS
ncbi:sensor histidine kinase [Peristeroidobacter soli]|uniref:sensor histidine kinase n=1 Tax=Peristeroidobacter soli TaxID=2497877 RepID=UPI001C37D79A|nr:sensor histidine kinase KdpD [Peristeroidobacter soli]